MTIPTVAIDIAFAHLTFMKFGMLLLGIASVLSSALQAAPYKGLLIIGGAEINVILDQPLIVIATGEARAQIGDLRVSAREIVFDHSSGRLTCHDIRSISPSHAASEGKDETLIIQAENVYRLNPSGTPPSGIGSSSEVTDEPSPAKPFAGTLPKLDLSLLASRR